MGISAESFAENTKRNISIKAHNKEGYGITDDMEKEIEGMYGHLRFFDGEMAGEYGASLFYQVFRYYFQSYLGTNEISDVIKNIVKH